MADRKKYYEMRKRSNEKRKKIRQEKRKQHICVYHNCNEKCKPIIIHYQFCEKHKAEQDIINKKCVKERLSEGEK